MAELAAAPMAVARGLPHVTVAFSGALPSDAFPLLIDSITPMWQAEHVAVPAEGGLADDLYLHPFPPSFGQLPSSGRVRSMRADGFDGDPSALAPQWIGALGVQRPLVYLTSGTEPTASRAPWAEAFEALGSFDVDVVATIGQHVDPSGFGDLPPNVRVERFVPQRWLLEKASVVASHGGAGSVLAAAASGIPQVLNPIAADQWENADAVVAAGVGVVCEPDQRSVEDLSRAFELVLGDSDMRVAAARVAAEIAAMPSVETYVAEIEELANR
jgi:UDP:flavonoid glycosyltransferase YjiC (YdhE family)